MKRSNIASIMIAVGFIIIGLCITFVGFAAGGFDTDKLSTQTYETKEQSVDPTGITDIVVDVESSDVTIVYKNIDQIKITYDEDEKEEYLIKESGGKLDITYKHNKKWYDYIHMGFFNFGSDGMIIEVPMDMKVNLDINSVSGDVYTSSIQSDKVYIRTVSGNIEVNDISGSNLSLSSTSGHIDIGNIKTDEVKLKSVSGNIEVDDAVGENISMKSTSGDLEFDRLEYDNIDIRTTSGNVDGMILGNQSAYSIISSTVSGDNNLSKDNSRDGSKSLDVSTTSGDIDISFR